MQSPNFQFGVPALEQFFEPQVLRVSPETPLMTVLRLMSQGHLEADTPGLPSEINRREPSPQNCALVMVGTQLLGLFTAQDAVRLMVAELTLTDRAIAEVMTPPLVTLPIATLQDPLAVLAILERHQIQHLPVVDQQGQYVGLITQSSLQRVIQADLKQLRSQVTELERDRQQVEANLRESETRFQQIAETIPEAFWMTDDKVGQIFYISPAYEQIWGRTCASLYANPQSFLEAIHPEDREQVRARLLAQEDEYTLDYRVVRPDGTIRWIWDHVFLVRNQTGEVYRRIGYAQDITDRKLLELALQASEANLQQMLQSAIAAIGSFRVFAHQHYEHDYISAGCETVYGYTTEEFLSDQQLWASRILPEDMAAVIIPSFAQVYAGVTYTIEYRFRDKTDQIRWIHETLTSRWDEAADCWQVTSVAVNISDRKQSELALQQLNQELEARVERRTAALRQQEQALRAMNERLNYLLAASPTGIFSCLPGGNFAATYVSENISRLLGYRPEAIIDDPDFWFSRIHPDDLARFMADLHQLLEVGHQIIEYRLRHQDGSYRWLRDEVRLIRDDAGQPIECVGSWVDITDRKQAELALSQGLEHQRLTAAIAHHIRESLDLDVILETTVTEVQQLLGADRVLVYRIWPSGYGSTIAEATAPGWPRVLNTTYPPEVFPEECHPNYLRGWVYALTDREQADILPCLQDFLAQLQVRAKLVVPIIQQQTLWGLLIVHQCSGPRQWQTWEMELLQHLATQLEIAIQQAMLYTQAQLELRERQQVEVQLQETLAQKNLLLKEVHHRVKNNLQVISSIFSLQSHTTTDPQVLTILRDNQNRIASIALVHTQLYQSENLVQIHLADYLRNLVRGLFNAYDVSPDRVRVRFEVAEIWLDPEAVITCGLLLNELISNALKHAFPDQRQGEIYLRFIKINQGKLCLKVEDDGIGLAADLDTQSPSLGLRLIRALTRQLQGELQIHSDRGTCFQVTFPFPQQRRRL